MPRSRQTILEYRTYALPSDFPIIILTGDRWHISDVPSASLHIHNCLEIGLCHSEGGCMRLGDTEVPFAAGTVTCIARNVPHTTWSAPGQSSRWSYLFLDPFALLEGSLPGRTPPSLGEDCLRMLTGCHFILRAEEHPWAMPLVEEILREYQSRENGYQAVICNLLTAMFLRLHRLSPEQAWKSTGWDAAASHSFSAIYGAVEYMHAHFDQAISVEELAALCHLSTSHFRRLFTQYMGASPLRFLHQLRITQGCQLLRSTNSTVAEIALRVGYPSLSSFNQHFREFTGSSPSQWRRSGDDASPLLLTREGWTEAE